MVSLSLYPQFETSLMSYREVIELLLQLKSVKTHGKNYIKVKPPLVRHLLRSCLLHALEDKIVRCIETRAFDLYQRPLFKFLDLLFENEVLG